MADRTHIDAGLLSIRHDADVPFQQRDGRTLLLDVLRPEAPQESPVAAVIFVHGGGWCDGGRDVGMNRFLAERGYVTCSISYRLAHEACFPAPVVDARDALRWVKANAAQYGVDPERVGVWGLEAGAHTAAVLGVSAGQRLFPGDEPDAAGDSVTAVVNVGGVTVANDPALTDPPLALSSLLGASPADLPDGGRAFSPIAYVETGGSLPPFLNLHGTADTVVRPAHAERLHDALIRAGGESTYVPVAGGDHLLHAQWAVVEQLVLDFFSRALQPGAKRTI